MKVNYHGETTYKVPSPTMLGNRFVKKVRDGDEGCFFFDDFQNFIGGQAAAGGAAEAPWHIYIDTGNTVSQTALPGGVILLSTDNTDNDQVAIQAGGNAGAFAKLTKQSAHPTFFGARVKISQVATSIGWFFGLAGVGAPADNLMADDTMVMNTSLDYIGFACIAGTGVAPTTLKVVAKVSGQTELVYAANALTNSLYRVGDMSDSLIDADTWYDLECYFDGDQKLHFYINGVPVSADADSTKLYMDLADTTNYPAAQYPGTNYLSPLLTLKNGTGAASVLSADGVYVGTTYRA